MAVPPRPQLGTPGIDSSCPTTPLDMTQLWLAVTREAHGTPIFSQYFGSMVFPVSVFDLSYP